MAFLKELILGFDKSVYFFFQHLQRPWLDYFLAWPTRMGEPLIALSLLTAGVLIFARKKSFQSIAAGVVAVLTASWVYPVLKVFFHRPRPYVYWEHISVIFPKPPDASFPSGHTAVVFAAAFILNRCYPGKIPWVYAVAAWVAITRIYVGAHYPSDVIGGAVLGLACGLFGWRLMAYFERRNAQIGETEKGQINRSPETIDRRP